MPSINMPTRAPQEEKGPSTLDVIAKGLDIAKGVYGIYSDINTLSKQKELYDLQKPKVEAEAAAFKAGGDVASPETTRSRAVGQAFVAGLGQTQLFKDNPEALSPLMEVVRTGSANEISRAISDNPLVAKVVSLAEKSGDRELAQQLKGLQIQSATKALQETKPNQAQAATFAKRITDSEKVFSDLAEKGFQGTEVGAAVQQNKLFPEILKSEDVKRIEQAKRNFINAVLRRESGAAISPSEFSSGNKQYFPQVGDTPEVLNQKAQNRADILAGLALEAGPALGKISGAKPTLNTIAKPKQAPVSKQDIEAELKRRGL